MNSCRRPAVILSCVQYLPYIARWDVLQAPGLEFLISSGFRILRRLKTFFLTSDLMRPRKCKNKALTAFFRKSHKRMTRKPRRENKWRQDLKAPVQLHCSQLLLLNALDFNTHKNRTNCACMCMSLSVYAYRGQKQSCILQVTVDKH